MKIKIILFIIGCTYVHLAAQTKEQKQASSIIGFSNTVIDLSNSFFDGLKNYDGIFSNAEQNIERLQSNPKSQIFAINCPTKQMDRALKLYDTELAKAIIFTEKNKIKSSVEEAENNTKKIETWCTKVSNYFADKEYTSDKDLNKSFDLLDSLQISIERASVSWKNASNLASDVGNRAELVLLKSSKIADFVIPMKIDLVNVRKVLELLEEENPDLKAMEQVINSLSSIKINEDISKKDVSKLKDPFYKEVYTDFYRSLQSCTDSLNEIYKAMKSKNFNDNIENQYKSLVSNYSKAVNNYNTFVSQ